LATLHFHGVAPKVAQDLYRWYIDTALGTGGAHTKEAEDAFRAYAKGKLPAKLIEDLVRFHRG
jgi:hypothetical protein